MRIQTLLAVGMVIGAAIAAAIGSSLYLTHQNVNEALRKDEVARGIARSIFELTALTSDYLLFYGKRARIQWKQKHESLGRSLEEPGFKDAVEDAAVAMLRAHQLEMGKIFAELVVTHTQQLAQEGQTDLLLEYERRLVTHLLIKSEIMENAASKIETESIAEVRKAERRAALLNTVLGASIMFVLAGTWIFVARRVVRPLGELQRGIQIIGGGNLDHRIGARARDEIGEVARAFNAMVDNLKMITASRDEMDAEITERKRAEEALARSAEELARSNAERERFASVAAHDLQEPLRKVQAFGDRLQRKHADGLDDQGRDYVARMQGAAGRMQTLIGNILSLSRIATKAQPFAPVDLNQVAQGVVSDLETRIRETGAKVDIAELPTIAADPSQMRQLLQNLLSNALKFRRERAAPVVKVEAHITENGLSAVNGQPLRACQITVADNGIGFDEEYADRIFGMCQRLHGRDEFEGTGVGLAICRKIAQRHGGSITAMSRPGDGATFVVTLPISRAEEGARVE